MTILFTFSCFLYWCRMCEVHKGQVGRLNEVCRHAAGRRAAQCRCGGGLRLRSAPCDAPVGAMRCQLKLHWQSVCVHGQGSLHRARGVAVHRGVAAAPGRQARGLERASVPSGAAHIAPGLPSRLLSAPRAHVPLCERGAKGSRWRNEASVTPSFPFVTHLSPICHTPCFALLSAIVFP